MKGCVVLTVVLLFLASISAMSQTPLPGTPLGVTFPTTWTISEPQEPAAQTPLTEIYQFQLPEGVVQGDVVLLEWNWQGSQDNPNGWSDVFAFAESTPDTITVYSDPTDEVTPINLGRNLINPVFLYEPSTIPEIVYYQVPGTTYQLISDVPEPSGLLTLLCGAVGLGGLIRKRMR